MESPYDVLGIDPGADQAEVERAYRRRVKETHPDHGGSVRAFLEVRMAYEEIVEDVEADDRAEGPETGYEPGSGAADPGSDGHGRSSRPGDEGAERSRVEYLDYDVLADHGWSLSDPDLFEKASAADLDPGDYGRFLVEPGESLLEAAEGRGFAWPYACRGGACANCAVAITEGELSMPVNHVLPQEMVDRDIRLSCVGAPTTDEVRVIFNVKHLPDLDELRLPPHPFEQARRGRG